nr:MAG TPA: hypothetical protein [Caudoviricetes sp.]
MATCFHTEPPKLEVVEAKAMRRCFTTMATLYSLCEIDD